MRILLGGDLDMLADAPRISDAALAELTSPNVQYQIRSYWLPVTGEDGQMGITNGCFGFSRWPFHFHR